MTDPEIFFTLHRDLPREGPGSPEDVAWAADVSGLAPDARILDAGCGPGADIAALLAAAPMGHVTAIDAHAPFAERAAAAWQDDARVTAYAGDMLAAPGPFGFIWCAGAAYFAGVTEALTAWREVLAPDGVVAFSEPCWLTDAPSAPARALWEDYPAITDAAGIDDRVRAAGFRTLATRVLPPAAWEAYYAPMEARIADLRQNAPEALRAVLDLHAQEIANYRAAAGETSYLLSVVRPA